jgi:predicted RNA-binding Zn-ribbon protein involved in translation (DUF1610 family)
MSDPYLDQPVKSCARCGGKLGEPRPRGEMAVCTKCEEQMKATVFECDECGGEYEEYDAEMPPHVCTACAVALAHEARGDDDADPQLTCVTPTGPITRPKAEKA